MDRDRRDGVADARVARKRVALNQHRVGELGAELGSPARSYAWPTASGRLPGR